MKIEQNTYNVIDNKIGIMRIRDVDYISLTDLVRYADAEEADVLNVALFGMTAKKEILETI